MRGLTHSILTPLNPHASEPPPQLPRPARTAPNALLPVRVLLPISTHGPRLAFDAHRSPLGGGRRHFDGVVAFGCVAGVQLVFFEGLFERVRGLAFAFEVVGVVLLGISVSLRLRLSWERGDVRRRAIACRLRLRASFQSSCLCLLGSCTHCRIGPPCLVVPWRRRPMAGVSRRCL